MQMCACTHTSTHPDLHDMAIVLLSCQAILSKKNSAGNYKYKKIIPDGAQGVL